MAMQKGVGAARGEKGETPVRDPRGECGATAEDGASRAPKPVEKRAQVQWGTAWAVGLFLLALGLRLPRLGRADLWVDEILFFWFSSPPQSPWTVVARQWERMGSVVHLPLAQVVENLFLWLVRTGAPEAMARPEWVRLPAALWGACMAPVVFLMARRLLTWRGAAAAGLFAAGLFFPVYYSREAYCYAPLMVCSALSLLYLARFVNGEVFTRRAWAAWCAALGGLVYSHVTGLLVLGVMALGLAAWSMAARARARSASPPRIGSALGAMLLALGLVSPFYIQLARTTQSLPIQSSGMSPLQILHDALTKQTFGSHVPWAVAGWALLSAGLIRLVWRSRENAAAGLLAWTWGAAALALTYGAWRSQYFPRYFSALSPLTCLVLASGWESVVGVLVNRARRYRGPLFAWGTGALLLAHFAWAVTPLYALRAKFTDFRGLAEWLVQNLRPGRPYMFDCGGWDLRFVPGFYPTPGLTPAARIAWNGPDFPPALLAVQTQIATRFPESAFIESLDADPETRQRSNQIRAYYRRRAELLNPEARLLQRRGLWPGGRLSERVIFYNAPEDLPALARERGEIIWADLTNWRCEAVGHEIYAWVPGAWPSEVPLENLLGSNVVGTLTVQAALLGPNGEQDLTVYLDGTVLGRRRMTPGRVHNLEFDGVSFGAGRRRLAFSTVPSLSGERAACVLFSVSFAPRAKEVGP